MAIGYYINSCYYLWFHCLLFFAYVVHSTDVSDVIQRKQSSINYKPTVKKLINSIPIIHQSGLARNLAWHIQVGKAAEGESDTFWKQVCSETFTAKSLLNDQCVSLICVQVAQKTQEMHINEKCILIVLLKNCKTIAKHFFGLSRSALMRLVNFVYV